MLALSILSNVSTVALSCALLLYCILLAIYRLWFHPLARFPGPKAAALTKWYELYFDILKGYGGQYAAEIRRLHEVYGKHDRPIIRINPDEVHIDDPEWHETLYASNPTRRDKWPPAAKMTGTAFGTVEHDLHRKRRAANSRILSINAITNAEGLIKEQVERLSDIFKRYREKGQVLELRTKFLAFTTDTVALHALGQSMGLQDDERRAEEWNRTIRGVAKLTPLIKQFPWIIDVFKKLPIGILHKTLPDLARVLQLHHHMRSLAREFWNSYGSQAALGEKKSAQHLAPLFVSICQSSLPDSDKGVKRIAQEGFVMVSAGGETTSRVLSMAMFFIVSNSHVLERLREEIMTVMPDENEIPSAKALEKLHYLRAVIREVLRVSALITSRLPLVAFEEMHYGSWRIPVGVPVSMTIYDILLDASIYSNPHDFIPERWLEESAPSDDYFVAFGKGTRMCQGMRFAYTELYITIATLLRRFDFQIYETTREHDIDFVRDCFIGESQPDSLGVRMKIVGGRS